MPIDAARILLHSPPPGDGEERADAQAQPRILAGIEAADCSRGLGSDSHDRQSARLVGVRLCLSV